MLRAFTLATRKLLSPRPLPVYTLTSDAASSSSTAINDSRQNDRAAEQRRSILPVVPGQNMHPLLVQNTLPMGKVRWASQGKAFQVPNPNVIFCNMTNMLKCVDLAHMKDTPSPAFWVALTSGATQVVIPLLEVVGGYSPVLTIFQLHLAAMTVGFLGGVKWGLAVSKNPAPPATWETMKWAVTPTYIALLGLILPYPLGFLTVSGAMVSSLYLDLKSCAFPPWGNAVRLFLTLTTVGGLFLALVAYILFHNGEKDKKKKEEKKENKKEKNKGDQTRQNNMEGEEEKEAPRQN